MTQRKFWILHLLALLLSASASAVVWAQGSAAPPSSLMGRIRTFLGVQPRSVSVGGTRSEGEQTVCLLAPGPIEPSRSGPAVRVLDLEPALVLGSPLNEMEIRRGEAVLWSQLASSKAPISGRLAWPLPPLQTGERLVLALRPRGAAGGDWAVVTLEAASKKALQRYARKLEASSGSEERRLQLLDEAAAAGDSALAQALLWAPLTPDGGALVALQDEEQARCETPPSTR